MPVTIFQFESGNTESWLTVNDDGTVTYVSENAGWRMARRGMERSESTMSAEEAKERWHTYASDIDKALQEIAATKAGHSN
ncbi:hypothetical protein MesoLj113c_12420 [Mesorhizobium sp. 113-3-9]|uniref:hypothetical protein n=1 Tax=Mesorhizobium sp. 113-3-9 TaxID=2744517 RepID=UPI0019272EFE|nr:hypothetical protein [Mesorhizobium sp. 113-3-9]BCG85132.1 hypothetical protein MesoLj113c_12420 [Mesorhizobium sp. 113-3-9]